MSDYPDAEEVFALPSVRKKVKKPKKKKEISDSEIMTVSQNIGSGPFIMPAFAPAPIQPLPSSGVSSGSKPRSSSVTTVAGVPTDTGAGNSPPATQPQARPSQRKSSTTATLSKPRKPKGDDEEGVYDPPGRAEVMEALFDQQKEEKLVVKYARLEASAIKIFKRDSCRAIVIHDKFICIGTAKGAIHQLDINGNEVFALLVHTGAVVSMALSHDGEYLVSAAKDGIIVVTNMYTRETKRPEFKTNAASSVCFPVSVHPSLPNKWAGKGLPSFVAGRMDAKVTISQKGWGASYAHRLLSPGDGPIQAMCWRGDFLAFADKNYVKVIDMNTETFVFKVAKRRLSQHNYHVDKDSYRCHLAWAQATVLIIGWGDTVFVGALAPREMGYDHAAIQIKLLDQQAKEAKGLAKKMNAKYVWNHITTINTKYVVCGVCCFSTKLDILILGHHKAKRDPIDQAKSEEERSREPFTSPTVSRTITKNPNRAAEGEANNAGQPGPAAAPSAPATTTGGGAGGGAGGAAVEEDRDYLELEVVSLTEERLMSDVLGFFEPPLADPADYSLESGPEENVFYISSPKDIIVISKLPKAGDEDEEGSKKKPSKVLKPTSRLQTGPTGTGGGGGGGEENGGGEEFGDAFNYQQHAPGQGPTARKKAPEPDAAEIERDKERDRVLQEQIEREKAQMRKQMQGNSLFFSPVVSPSTSSTSTLPTSDNTSTTTSSSSSSSSSSSIPKTMSLLGHINSLEQNLAKTTLSNSSAASAKVNASTHPKKKEQEEEEVDEEVAQDMLDEL